MKRIAFLIVALSACEKSNDLGKLQDEATRIVAKAKPEIEDYTHRSNEMLKLGRGLPASTPGIQQAGEVLSEANGKISELRTLLDSAPADIDHAYKTGIPENVAIVIDHLRDKLEKNTVVIDADLMTVEAWLDQHAPRS